MKSLVKKVLREPLLHFLVVGGALFALYSWVGTQQAAPPERIVVTRGQVDQLILGFTRTWQRPPSEQELQGLIKDHIREDVFYRQAKKMGLDEDDTIVRRRLQQKLEFLTEDLTTQMAAPTDQELQTYYRQHADQYQEERRFSFEQVFISRDRHGKAAEAVAMSLLAQLNAKPNAEKNNNALGDTTLLPVDFKMTSTGEITQLFGEKFTQHLRQATPGRWVGPILSNHGLHLVFMHEQSASRTTDWTTIRKSLVRDVLNDRRKQTLEKTYDKLISTYQVVVEPFAPTLSQPNKSVVTQ